MLNILFFVVFMTVIGYIFWRNMTVKNRKAVKDAIKQAVKDTFDVNKDGKVNAKDAKAAVKKVTKKPAAKKAAPRKSTAKKTTSIK